MIRTFKHAMHFSLCFSSLLANFSLEIPCWWCLVFSSFSHCLSLFFFFFLLLLFSIFYSIYDVPLWFDCVSLFPTSLVFQVVLKENLVLTLFRDEVSCIVCWWNCHLISGSWLSLYPKYAVCAIAWGLSIICFATDTGIKENGKIWTHQAKRSWPRV